MNAPCSRCKKTVYPVEKLSCLDKTWHKACFTCETCNMKLTMKTYKGYNKLPYCVTHYPTTKFTAVADTPENRRLQKQTQNQSSLEYTKEHKHNLQKFTQVDETPSNVTCKRNQQNVSQANYTNRAEARDKQEAARMALAPDQEHPPAQPSFQSGYTQPPSLTPAAPVAPPPQPPPSGPRYRALYDYSAADPDEVSFSEGDVIIDTNIIDDGWMEGRVERTGQYGMLPSNYVEKA